MNELLKNSHKMVIIYLVNAIDAFDDVHCVADSFIFFGVFHICISIALAFSSSSPFFFLFLNIMCAVCDCDIKIHVRRTMAIPGVITFFLLIRISFVLFFFGLFVFNSDYIIQCHR